MRKATVNSVTHPLFVMLIYVSCKVVFLITKTWYYFF